MKTKEQRYYYEDKKILLSSAKSIEISLEQVRQGKAGLNKHRKAILARVPDSYDWATFPKESISLKDIAYLTAQTGDEFAVLTGKKEDILFHGIKNHCIFTADLCELLISGQYKLYGHSHPGERVPMASRDDRETLKLIGQKKSRLVSAVTGREIEYSDNAFDNLQNESSEEGSVFGDVNRS